MEGRDKARCQGFGRCEAPEHTVMILLNAARQDGYPLGLVPMADYQDLIHCVPKLFEAKGLSEKRIRANKVRA